MDVIPKRGGVITEEQVSLLKCFNVNSVLDSALSSALDSALGSTLGSALCTQH